MDSLPYARSTGAAGFMSDATRSDRRIPLLSLASVIILIAMTTSILTAIVTALAVTGFVALLINRLKARIQGYTGDALGACEQLTETLIPLVFLACL
jgi:adenosylcobinamide-GDP ribazoletransferase